MDTGMSGDQRQWSAPGRWCESPLGPRPISSTHDCAYTSHLAFSSWPAGLEA